MGDGVFACLASISGVGPHNALRMHRGGCARGFLLGHGRRDTSTLVCGRRGALACWATWLVNEENQFSATTRSGVMHTCVGSDEFKALETHNMLSNRRNCCAAWWYATRRAVNGQSGICPRNVTAMPWTNKRQHYNAHCAYCVFYLSILLHNITTLRRPNRTSNAECSTHASSDKIRDGGQGE